LFPALQSITTPQFNFEYGNSELLGEKSNDFYKEESFGLCLYSLPRYLYFLETGARFKICLPANKEDVSAIKSGFLNLDTFESSRTLFQWKNSNWEFREITYGKWQKENKDLIPKESYKGHQTIDGTIAFSRFSVPSAEFYQWEKDRCEVLFPSRALGQTKNSWRWISLSFTCDNIEIGSKIFAQNESWLRECTVKNPKLSETFRHSESPYGRFLEWENETDEVLCPIYENFGFLNAETKKSVFLASKERESLKKFHKLILPHSVLLLKTAEQLDGIQVEEDFLSWVGKPGSWFFVDEFTNQRSYNFKQGDEFFSDSNSRQSCKDGYQYQFSESVSCLSPGIPNSIRNIPLDGETPNCNVDQLQITEYFGGSETSASIPIFVEIKNLGNACDLSNNRLTYAEEIFDLAAKEKIIRTNELILVSRSLWDGWPFQSISRSFSTKQYQDKIPELTLSGRDSFQRRIYRQGLDLNVLTNLDGENRRSVLLGENGDYLPHPNEFSIDLFSANGYYMSPGKEIDLEGPSFLDPKLSELLIAGTKDGSSSYPERFIEWEADPYTSGFIHFQLSFPEKQRFVFYKEKGQRFPFVKSGEGLCLPKDGIRLPEGSLPNTSFLITNLSKQSLPFSIHSTSYFTYSPEIYELSEYNSSSRISIHPEPFPFSPSITLPNSFGNLCSPHSDGTPGKENRKKNQVAEELELGPNSEVLLKYFSFLFPPSVSSTYVLFSQTKNQIVNSPILGNRLNLTDDFGSLTFSSGELIYLKWLDLSQEISQDLIARLGEVRIESVYPSPQNPQNEWIYFCNLTESQINTNGYMIEDETSSDYLVPYGTRFPNTSPSFRNGQNLNFTDPILYPGQCAFIVDPDGSQWNFPAFVKNTDRLLTVISSQTIGNGISNLEKLDLFKEMFGQKILVSTYGKKNTASSFQIKLNNLEYSLIKKETLGNRATDYLIYRESL